MQNTTRRGFFGWASAALAAFSLPAQRAVAAGATTPTGGRRVQIWKPDTCGCSIEQSHNPDDPSAAVLCTRVLAKCAAHRALADGDVIEAVWAYPHGENRRKNLMHKQFVDAHGVSPDWSFEGHGTARVLRVHAPETGAIDRVALQAYADRTFGAGKVSLG
jgi:hypothetical protein